MMNTLRSEWCKLTTTKAFYWTTALIVVITVALTAIVVAGIKMSAHDAGVEGGFVNADFAASSLLTLGMTIIIIQAAMVFTSEYRHGGISVTYAATPNRTRVILAKTLLYAVVAAIITFITLLLNFLVAVKLAGATIPGVPEFHPLSDAAAHRYMWFMPFMAATLVVITMGVSVLVRQTAGAIAVMVIWFLAFELVLSNLGKIGAKIANFMPFTNLQAFRGQKDLPNFFLNYHQSLWLYLAWCVVLLVLGIIVANRRDA